MRRVFLCLVLLAAVFSCGRPRLIPEEKMSRIYADMLLVDQWVDTHAELKSATDSFFVYGGVLRKYGYTSEDYRYSVRSYMKDAENFSKVLEKTKNMLDDSLKRFAVLDSLEIEKNHAALPDAAGDVKIPALFRDMIGPFSPLDTVAPAPDSLDYAFIIPVLDTVYCGPAFSVRRDTLGTAAADTVQVHGPARGTMVKAPERL